VLSPPQAGVFHAVVTDRFYTSLQLALQLLSRNVYTVGTIQTNKQGFPPAIKAEHENRPPHIPRGTTRMAVAKCCPSSHCLAVVGPQTYTPSVYRRQQSAAVVR
jgi:hypothetical protein